MTQEEKAKAYDEALEWMRKVYPTLTGADKEDAEHYFPELAESEDERMINGLQGFLSAFGSDYFGTDGWQKFDDWLEKQKEQKPTENSGKELLYVSNKSYNIGYRDGKREAESKQEWSEEDEKMRVLAFRIVNGFKNGLRFVGEENNKEAEKVVSWLKSLRPSHWKPSEEQMYSLGSVVNGAGEATEGSIAYHLKELYEQLKKL